MVIVDDAMIFSMQKQHLGDLANLLKALINFSFKISLYKCHFLRDLAIYLSLIFMLKERKTFLNTDEKEV